MNTEKVEGKFDQVAGKIKQGVGEAVGNQKLANAGAAEQIKGAAKETWGNAKDTANVVREDNRAKAKRRGGRYEIPCRRIQPTTFAKKSQLRLRTSKNKSTTNWTT